MQGERLLYETHMHTTLCKHAEGEPEEYAAQAERRGLAGIIVTCHNPMPDSYASSSVRMDLDQFDRYLELVDRARAACAPSCDVRLGIECDYFPGYESFLSEQVASAPFEYVIGSVHPHQPIYIERYYGGDAVEFQKAYFTHLAEAAELGLFDCISHPDLVKNSFPEEWQVGRIFDHIRRCLDRIARTGRAMELNTSGLQKSIPEFNPFQAMLVEMRQRGIPVVVGADAHVPWRAGADFETALDCLEQAGYENVSFFLERRRRDVPIARARASLRRG